jgi:diguanylate cyclase
MDLWNLHLPIPLALAVVATLGYLIGRRKRNDNSDSSANPRRELRRAQLVASELEKIALTVRRSLANHHARVHKFKERVGKLSAGQQEAAWKELCREAEEILKPTMRLATEIATAYDEIRQQSANLMTFTEARTDPLTGLSNRRALDDALASQFAMMARYDTMFSVAILDIDHFKSVNDQQGHLSGDRILKNLAILLDESVRETDVAARYGGEEFVIVMPQTNLNGACVFTERLRKLVEQDLSITLSAGVAKASSGDSRDTLLARADAALYSAKTNGRNCVFRHDGVNINQVVEETCLANG